MNVIRLAIERPVAVLSVIAMIVLFGIASLRATPIQLTPDVNRPVITVSTVWPGAAPAEIEREIINRQEDVLRGLEGVVEMSSSAADGTATVTLEFNVNQDMNRALLLVGNRLDQVTGYPEEVDEPRLDSSGSDDQPIAWFILHRLPGNERPIHTFGQFADDVIRDRLERVPGVSRINVLGGSEREMKVIVDPEKMARYGLTVPDVVRTLREANSSVTAGDVDEGKRRYVVRMEGELTSPELVRGVLLRSLFDPATRRMARVTVGDIAEVRIGYKEPVATIRHRGEPALAINAVRKVGANVIDVMAGLQAAIAELNRDAIPGQGLKFKQVYDETTYINQAIDLVVDNIWQGGALAALALLVFLRSGRATLIIALMMPVVVIGSFIAMALLGRSINVVLLAGLAFGVGLVVDSAIVVLENIFRLRQQGMPAPRAAFEGTRQIWGAVWLSMLTTFVVFLPLLLLRVEIGQLFGDIAVAITTTALFTLLMAAVMIPCFAAILLRRPLAATGGQTRIPVLDDFARWFVRFSTGITRFIVARPSRCLAVVVLVCGVTALATWAFLPKLEYLPEGSRNLVLAVLQPPPGYNLETTTEIAKGIEAAMRPLWTNPDAPAPAASADPLIDNFFFVARRSGTFVGATAADPNRVGELIAPMEEVVFREPGTFGFVSQPSLFGRVIGSGRSLDLHVSGPDLDQVLAVAQRATRLLNTALPRDQGNQMRPRPGLELGAPEVRLYPDPVRLADAGVDARGLGETIDAFNDGLRVAEITFAGDRIDLTLTGPEDTVDQTQGISSLPVVTESGTIVPASSLANVVVTAGPTEIRHLERERTVTLEIRPTQAIALEQAMTLVRTKVIEPLQAEGLPTGLTLRLAGTADKLTQTWNAMKWQLLLALAVVYLAIAIQFESFIFPLIVTLSVPLATAGGIGGLAVLNLFHPQPLDMLTMLGFVILIGSVGNNAILIVDQTLHHARDEGMDPEDAIIEASRNRIRPIFMSTLTSIVGMLPLVVYPGAGSELYRGLGSVVVGGLTLSAILTLTIIPPLLRLAAPLIGPRRFPPKTVALPEKRAAE
jgi:HAE1 family hydrophobic/amphiphilic exporter-1